jgi:hypothetical protein
VKPVSPGGDDIRVQWGFTGEYPTQENLSQIPFSSFHLRATGKRPLGTLANEHSTALALWASSLNVGIVLI